MLISPNRETVPGCVEKMNHHKGKLKGASVSGMCATKNRKKRLPSRHAKKVIPVTKKRWEAMLPTGSRVYYPEEKSGCNKQDA